MLIAQISDSHLRARGVRLFGAVDTYGALTRAVDAILGLDPRPDAVIHTGDLVNDGDEADHAALAELIARLPMPFCAVPGNHDRRELLREALAATGRVAPEGPLTVCADVGPVRLVGLDTLVEGEAGGRIGADQLSWLDSVLADAPDRPILVFLHHPPFATGIGFMDRIMLADHERLAGVIGRHPQVGLVACGHVHRMIQTRFAGTIAMIAPGVAHQVVLDLRADAPARWIAEPPAMLLHRWTPQAGFVSHLACLGWQAADAPFHGHHPRTG
jgi:3',5'-cyclic-AMP phosphodiesterase